MNRPPDDIQKESSKVATSELSESLNTSWPNNSSPIASAVKPGLALIQSALEAIPMAELDAAYRAAVEIDEDTEEDSPSFVLNSVYYLTGGSIKGREIARAAFPKGVYGCLDSDWPDCASNMTLPELLATDLFRIAAKYGWRDDFVAVDLACLAHHTPQPRRFVIQDWAPQHTLIFLTGPGGVGKSLLALQTMIAICLGLPWFKVPTVRGPVIGIFCEDDAEELQRRALGIFVDAILDPVEVGSLLHLYPRVGSNNKLVTFSSDGVVKPTAFMSQIEEQCRAVKPALLVLDNIAHVYGDDGNNTEKVTAFCNYLSGVAARLACAVLLIGHPTKSSSSEYRGSIAWEASARTRWYLEARDDGTVALHRAKANYASTGETIVLEYRSGVFESVDSGSTPNAVDTAKPAVLAALDTFTNREQATSHLPTAKNYLIRLMAREHMLAEFSEAVLGRALHALIDAQEITPNAALKWKDSSRHTARGLAKNSGKGTA